VVDVIVGMWARGWSGAGVLYGRCGGAAGWGSGGRRRNLCEEAERERERERELLNHTCGEVLEQHFGSVLNHFFEVGNTVSIHMKYPRTVIDCYRTTFCLILQGTNCFLRSCKL
jgi:hypothetical protein